MPIYKIGNYYTYSDGPHFINKLSPNFREIVVSEAIRQSKTWLEYIVYNWNLSEIIEEGEPTTSNESATNTVNWVKISNVTPNSGLIDGADTKFKIVIEYNLSSVNKANLRVCFKDSIYGG
jgi:hypothetical protein